MVIKTFRDPLVIAESKNVVAGEKNARGELYGLSKEIGAMEQSYQQHSHYVDAVYLA